MNLEKSDENKIVNKAVSVTIVRTIIVVIITFFALINVKKINKLSRISSQGLFGQNSKMGPELFFGLIIIVLLVFAIFFYYIYRVKKENKPTNNLSKTFEIYDFFTFAITSVICLLFLMMFVLTPCTVDGDSMNNTYQDKDKIIMWHMSYKPKVDDVVVIEVTTKNYGNRLSEMYILKRIVAVENDVVEYKAANDYIGDLYINDVLVENSITKESFERMSSNETVKDNKFTMPKERYLVLGDNRKNSADSRALGLIHEEDILGKIILRVFPINKIGNPKKNIR